MKIRLFLIFFVGCLLGVLVGFWAGYGRAEYHWPKDGWPWPRGITLAKALRERGILPENITHLRFIGDECSYTAGKVALMTDTNDIKWIWDRMIETAEPYVFWESSGYRRVEIYIHGSKQPAAMLCVNATDATHIAGDYRRFMCHGLEELAMRLLIQPDLDLSQVPPLCPKGRVQDKEYNPDVYVVNELIKKGKEAIPLLISKLADDTDVNHQVMCFWPGNTIGDIALVILTDLTTDSSWRHHTIPGTSWDDLLEQKFDPNIPTWSVLHSYVREHGRQNIKEKWEIIWDRHKENIYWDDTQRCFNISGTQKETEKLTNFYPQ
jgi:hypothetical protein